MNAVSNIMAIYDKNRPPKTPAKPLPENPDIRDFLDIQAWAERDIPEPDRLLGDFITTTSRAFLVGRTGLGKTMIGFALAAGMASGTGFCHWRSTRPARVLYIDGEMPGELIKARSIEALRRSAPVPRGGLVIYSRDTEEEFARLFPGLGAFAPLNTPEGQEFIFRLIDVLGGVDCIVFDNVMSLVAGDQKDEVSWSDTLPLVSALTARRIGQVWLDHTGHNTDRQYGSSTKAWRFDAVGVMRSLPAGQIQRGEVGFSLSFDGADNGKARRRTPANWQDFETRIFRLAEDKWTSSPPDGAEGAKGPKLPPATHAWRDALLDAFVASSTPGTSSRDGWYAEAVRHGLADAITPDDTPKEKAAKRATMRKHMGILKTAGLIGVDGEKINDLSRPKQP